LRKEKEKEKEKLKEKEKEKDENASGGGGSGGPEHEKGEKGEKEGNDGKLSKSQKKRQIKRVDEVKGPSSSPPARFDYFYRIPFSPTSLTVFHLLFSRRTTISFGQQLEETDYVKLEELGLTEVMGMLISYLNC